MLCMYAIPVQCYVGKSCNNVMQVKALQRYEGSTCTMYNFMSCTMLCRQPAQCYVGNTCTMLCR